MRLGHYYLSFRLHTKLNSLAKEMSKSEKRKIQFHQRRHDGCKLMLVRAVGARMETTAPTYDTPRSSFGGGREGKLDKKSRSHPDNLIQYNNS